jgi:NAD(P)H-hydrate epimerase
MAAPKYGHFLGEGRAKTGHLEIIDIGVPPKVYRALAPRGMQTTADIVRFPQRSPLAHKGDFGRIGIIAGSPGFSGAAVLASRAALRAGGGLITLFHPAGMDTIFEIKLTEVMTCAIPFAAENRYDIAAIEEKLSTMDVLLFGPGVGTSPHSLQMLEYLMASWHKPLIIDADGLNLLSAHPHLLGQLACKPILLTPHLGEFARLATCSIMAVREQTIARLTAFTRAHGVAVLLKSATTILAAGEALWFDTTGNDALATGGSGDVLAGIIASFVGQKLSVQDAAVAASWLLGTTAEKLCNTRGSASVIPSDIIEALFCL